MNAPLVVDAIGWRAHAALVRSGGATTPVPGFADAPYACAGGELIAFADRSAAMHPRMVVVSEPTQRLAGRRLHIGGMTPWRCPSLPANDADALVRGCEALRHDLPRVGKPRGFAAMLAGQTPEFPLAGAAELVRRFARALRNASPDALYDAASRLLGVGVGLTPSGDDLVGAALFARRMMADSGDDALALHGAVARLVDASHSRTHAIGAALFRDLVMGESFAPLHHLANTVGCGGPREHAIDAARALVAVGHSSGWEMLAGFVLGISGTLTPGTLTPRTLTPWTLPPRGRDLETT